MPGPEGAETAISTFYRAATGTAAWQDAFDALLAAAGFEAAAFYVLDRATGQPIEERWHRFDTAFAEPYLRDYVAIDPRAAEVFKPAPERILYDHLHTQEEEIDRDPFYAWFQASQGHRYYVGGQSRFSAAAPGQSLAMTLTLHRRRGHGHASRAEIARFAGLFGHFEHAVQLQHQLGLDAATEAIRLSEMDSAAHGVVLLDRAGRVLHANRTACGLAGRGDGLILTPTGLGGASAADDDALRRLTAAALAGRVTIPHEIARRFGGHSYVVTAYPWPAPETLVSAGRPGAALRILDPDAGLQGAARAASLLGLTRQETRVLEALLEGADPAEIAAANGLRPATIRTYLAGIYRKAGVNRQAALVARVAALERFL